MREADPPRTPRGSPRGHPLCELQDGRLATPEVDAADLTAGVEEEFCVVDAASGELRLVADEILAPGLAREQLVNGCHVHVGIADGDEAIAVLGRVRPWLATIVALAANSPFWEGADSGYASYRTEVWARWPLTALARRGEMADVLALLLA